MMIRRTYLKMTGPQILASVSSMLCLLIDSVVISRFLGVDAMSAYGLVSPIRTVHKGDCLALHFRDNCVLFDPTEYVALHRAGGPDHIGLRMVMHMVDEAVYINSLGLNNLFFTVHCKR